MVGPSPCASIRAPAGRAHIIAVTGLGSGGERTSVVVNLACAMAERGHRTAIVDADPNGGSSARAAEGRLPVSCVLHPLQRLDQVEAWMGAVGALRPCHELVVIDLPPDSSPALAISCLFASIIVIVAGPDVDRGYAARVHSQLTCTRFERTASPPTILLVSAPGDTGQGVGDRPRAGWASGFAPVVSAGSGVGTERARLARLITDRLTNLAAPAWPTPVAEKVAVRPPLLPWPTGLVDHRPAATLELGRKDVWPMPAMARRANRFELLLRSKRTA